MLLSRVDFYEKVRGPCHLRPTQKSPEFVSYLIYSML